jgi:hypothetical protein
MKNDLADDIAECVSDDNGDTGWTPENLVRPECLEEYKRELEAVWWQLVRLNSSLFILRKLSDYPFELLFLQDDLHFWDLTIAGLSDTCIMIACKLAIDNDDDSRVLTIYSLRDNIKDCYLIDNHRQKFEEKLCKCPEITDPKSKIIKLRNNQLAHFNRDWNVSPTPLEIREREITLEELEKIRDALNNIFDILCLGHYYEKLPPTYFMRTERPEDEKHKTDVENILYSISKDNALINMPEEQPKFWPHFRGNLSNEDVDRINVWREKVGKPKVLRNSI